MSHQNTTSRRATPSFAISLCAAVSSVIALLCAAPALAQSEVEVLNRTNVGLVTNGGNVRLKFDYLSTPAEQTYQLTTPASTAFPVGGRWDPDTTQSVGIYNRSDDKFYLRNAQTAGSATTSFKFFPGSPPSGTLFPVMGDWDGDGIDTAGIYNRNTGLVYLKNANSSSAPIVHTIAYPGVAGTSFRPVAGDWDGNGSDEIGVLDRATEVFRLFGNLPSTSYTDYFIPSSPGSGVLWPVAGDWDFDGKDFVGVWGSGNKTFYLLESSAQLTTWDAVFTVSNGAGLPVAGSWDGESFRYAVPALADGSRPRTFPQLVATSPTTYDLYFSWVTTALPGSESLYYNRYSGPHLYTNSGWQLSSNTELVGNTGATALGVVLSDSNPVFKHPSGSFYKKMIVYVVEHPVPAQFAGWVCLTYSNGSGWTQPIFATNDPTVTPRPCTSPGNSTTDVLAELVSGFRDGPNLFFGVMNGDNPTILADAQNSTTRTHTYLYTTDTSMPWYFDQEGEFTNNGVTTPNTNGNWNHNYGVNLDFTFDPVEYAVYWTRSYSYPFELNGNLPCNNQGCPSGGSLNPNRVQIYRIPLVQGESEAQMMARFFAGPWQLIVDLGSAKGYPSTFGGSCASTPLTSGFQSSLLGIDINGCTFVKDTNGQVARDSAGKRALLFGGAAIKDRQTAQCSFSERSIFIWREP